MPEVAEIVVIEITKPLPETGVIDTTYKIEGTAKMLEKIGAPPWVHAQVRLKEWFKPEFAEEVKYERGFPNPLTGKFSIDFKPEKEGEYEVTVVATPAPLSLPVVGVSPITGESDVMKLSIEAAPPAEFRFSGVTIDGHDIPLTNHDADSGLLLEKTTADYLDITPAFEWTGPRKTATISIKAGYKSFLLGFEPKTDAYTRTITLPESPTEPYSGELDTPIRIPLTKCGGLTDGALEVVLKIAGEPDYISHIWNVYATKPPELKKLFDILSVTVNERSTVNKVTDTDFDFETPTPMTTSDKLAVNFEFQWTGSARTVSVSIRAGHKGIMPWDFVEKTPYYTATVDLPEASGAEPFTGTLNKPIEIPLTACGGLTDGAIEIKVEDYISQVWNVYATKAVGLDFDLTRPSVPSTPVDSGTVIDITCPVTSKCATPVDAQAKVIIYEGSVLLTHGTKLKEYKSAVFHIEPDESKDIVIRHTAIAGTIDRRDVEVEIYVADQLVKESEWDDVYYVTEAPRGTISKKVLEYNETKGAIPVSGIPQDKRGLVHIWGRNDTKHTRLDLKIEWWVSDSDGEVEHYSDYDGVGPGDSHEFLGGRFNLDKAGDYTIKAILSIHEEEVELDRYEGRLCTVAEKEYKGTITKKQLEYNGTFKTIPVSGIPLDKRALIHIVGRNDTSRREDLGIHWLVYDPDGVLVEDYPDWSYGIGAGDHHEFEGGRFDLDKAGPYTIKIFLSLDYDNPKIVDKYEGTLCTVAAAPREYALTVSVAAPAVGYVTKSPDKPTYSSGERVTLTAYLDSWAMGDYVFSHWTVNGATRTGNPISVTMDRDRSVVAYFKEVAPPPPTKYTLTISVVPTNGGSVSGAGTYDPGAFVSVRATPNPGYEFSHWSADASGSYTTINFPINANLHFIANFRLKEVVTYTLEVRASPDVGYVEIYPYKASYEPGERVTLLAISPFPQYRFSHWGDDASGTNATLTITMDRNKSIIAYYVAA